MCIVEEQSRRWLKDPPRVDYSPMCAVPAGVAIKTFVSGYLAFFTRNDCIVVI